jgi:hypothetical protein
MEKKKVYVETTVVSDATALPSRDVIQLGRQLITKEWWQTASERFDLYSSLVVARETHLHPANAYGRRSRMTTKVKYDEGLEEIWRIKREIAEEYPTLDDYFKGMAAYREERIKAGVKLVQLEPFSPKRVTDEPQQQASFVAEDPPPPYRA